MAMAASSLGGAGLADPQVAGQEGDLALAGRCQIQARSERCHLTLTPHERMTVLPEQGAVFGSLGLPEQGRSQSAIDLPRFTLNSVAMARMLMPSDLRERTCCKNCIRLTIMGLAKAGWHDYTPFKDVNRDNRDTTVTTGNRAARPGMAVS